MLYEFPAGGPGGKITRFTQAEYPMPTEDTTRYRRKAASTLQLIGSPRLEDIAELQWRLSTPLSTVMLALLGGAIMATRWTKHTARESARVAVGPSGIAGDKR